MRPRTTPSHHAASTGLRTLFVLLTLLTSSLSAGDDSLSLKQLRKQVKQKLAAATKQLRASVSAELKDVTQDIKAARKQALAGEASVASVAALFDELVAYQKAVAQAHAATVSAEAIFGLFNQLDDNADYTGIYPLGFVDGDGSLIDEFRLTNRALVAKPYPRLRKQLLAFTKAAEQGSGLLITQFIRAPREHQHLVWNSAFGFQGQIFHTQIDLALGVSLEEGATDASRLFARGVSLATANFVVSGQGVNIAKLLTGTQIRDGVSLGGSGANSLARGNLRLHLALDILGTTNIGDELNIGIR